MKKNSPLASFALLFTFVFSATFAQIDLVKDFNTGVIPNSGSHPNGFVEYDNHIIFCATNPVFGSELWISDGTSNGTKFLKDIYPGSSSSNPLHLTVSHGFVYFLAKDEAHGTSLWRTDGTSQNTVLVKTFTVNDANQYRLLDVNGKLFVIEGNSGLWVIDAAGSEPVKLLSEFYVYTFTTFNNQLYFAYTGLWKSDGTVAGTVQVLPPPSGVLGTINELKNCNGKLFFSWDNGTEGTELWTSDGTKEGSHLVKDIVAGSGGSFPTYFHAFKENVFFSVEDAVSGRELWKTDGTAAGTLMVMDINPGTGSSNPSLFTTKGDTLFFFAYDQINNRLFKTDGTEAGTKMVYSYIDYAAITPVGDRLVFSSFGGTVSRHDNGTTEYLYHVQPSFTPKEWGPANSHISFKNKIFFAGSSAASGKELWETDGTFAGTKQVKEINAQGSGEVHGMISVGDVGFFAANYETGTALFKSDGTASGTVLLKPITTGQSSYVNTMAALGNRVLFAINSQIWVSDGTPTGTASIGYGLNIYKMRTLGERVIMLGSNEVWTSDATVSGTSVIKTFDYINYDYYAPSVGPGKYHYFTARLTSESGRALWRTDGTETGTVLVKPLEGESSYFHRFRDLNADSIIFFGVNGADAGLFVSNGTTAGTSLLKAIDLGNGRNGMVLSSTILHGGFLYFQLYQAEREQLWRTDGTPEGTQAVETDFSNEQGSYYGLYNFIEFQGDIYFTVQRYSSSDVYVIEGDQRPRKIANGLSQYGSLAQADGKLYFIQSIGFGNSSTTITALNDIATCERATGELFVNTFIQLEDKFLLSATSIEYGASELFVYDASQDAVCKLAQEINFTELPTAIYANSPSFEAVASATSNLAVTLESSDPSVASITAFTITPKAEGETTITATQAGNELYEAAEPISKVLSVGMVVSVEDGLNKATDMYPNPFTNSFLVRINSSKHQDATLSVYDATGSVVEENNSISTNQNHAFGISWQKGIYLIKVQAGGMSFVQKVVKK